MHSRLPYLLTTLLLFLTEVLIALYVDDSFIHPFVGDVLAVMLLFYGIKSFSKLADRKIITIVLLIACGVELLQRLDVVSLFQITTPRVRTVLGTTFDRYDLLAYGVGGAVCYIISKIPTERVKHSRTFFLTLARASLFGILFFAAVAWGKWITTFGLPMYDFLFVVVIGIQIVLLITKIETVEELKIILIYHFLGFVMELFKTHPAIGSRSYPGEGFFTIATVPLFGGFMYSAIGSFIFQARRLLDLKFTNFPPFRYTIPIAVLIYLNFFTHHFVPDMRYLLLIAVVIVAWKTRVYFRFTTTRRSIHVLLGLSLTGMCIWIAENIATYFEVRIYPNQHTGRHLVSVQKIVSRFLLFIVSFVVVSAWKMHYGKKQDEFEV